MEQNNTTALVPFEDLKALPEVLAKNEGILTRARLAIQPSLDTFEGFDITTVESIKAETLDAEMAEIQSKLSQSITRCEEARKPGTRMLNDIIKRFTSVENSLKELHTQVSDSRNAWQREKGRRIKAEQDLRDAELKARQDEIKNAAAAKELLHKEQTFLINSTVDRMINKYNSLAVDALDAYCDAIRVLDIQAYAGKIGVTAAYYGTFAAAMSDNIVTLLEQKESRKAELLRDKEAAMERAEKERQQREEQAKLKQLEEVANLQLQSESAQLEVAFETMAKPIETPELSKGTVVKKKYKVTNHSGHIAIARWWTQNILPGMSVEDLNKKLSFMRTSADKALNQGDVIEMPGLEITEDYSTRSTKTE